MEIKEKPVALSVDVLSSKTLLLRRLNIDSLIIMVPSLCTCIFLESGKGNFFRIQLSSKL